MSLRRIFRFLRPGILLPYVGIFLPPLLVLLMRRVLERNPRMAEDYANHVFPILAWPFAQLNRIPTFSFGFILLIIVLPGLVLYWLLSLVYRLIRRRRRRAVLQRAFLQAARFFAFFSPSICSSMA